MFSLGSEDAPPPLSLQPLLPCISSLPRLPLSFLGFRTSSCLECSGSSPDLADALCLQSGHPLHCSSSQSAALGWIGMRSGPSFSACLQMLPVSSSCPLPVLSSFPDTACRIFWGVLQPMLPSFFWIRAVGRQGGVTDTSRIEVARCSILVLVSSIRPFMHSCLHASMHAFIHPSTHFLDVTPPPSPSVHSSS